MGTYLQEPPQQSIAIDLQPVRYAGVLTISDLVNSVLPLSWYVVLNCFALLDLCIPVRPMELKQINVVGT
jgi:hypothetical protein